MSRCSVAVRLSCDCMLWGHPLACPRAATCQAAAQGRPLTVRSQHCCKQCQLDSSLQARAGHGQGCPVQVWHGHSTSKLLMSWLRKHQDPAESWLSFRQPCIPVLLQPQFRQDALVWQIAFNGLELGQGPARDTTSYSCGVTRDTCSLRSQLSHAAEGLQWKLLLIGPSILILLPSSSGKKREVCAFSAIRRASMPRGSLKTVLWAPHLMRVSAKLCREVRTGRPADHQGLSADALYISLWKAWVSC